MADHVYLGRSQHLSIAPRCPVCATVLDGATGVGHDERPDPGDPTVCLYCATALVFTADGLTVMPDGHLDDWPDVRAAVLSLQANIRLAHAEGRP